MKRKSTGSAECPVARTLDVIGDWWTLLIVRDAFDGVRRFSEFQRSLRISKGILATRLKALENAGIVEQMPPQSGGAHSEYILTTKGRDLFLVVVSLRQWGEAHCFDPGEAHSVLVERSSGQQIGPLRLDNAAGSVLDPNSTEVRKVDNSHRSGRFSD